MLRVLVADDHQMVREGLGQLLHWVDDIELVGSANDGGDAARQAEITRPDLVLMDLEMPGVDGVEGTRRVLEVAPLTRVVILTAFADRDRLDAAFDAGAVGYVLKDGEPAALMDAIRELAVAAPTL
jgi:DNA-binding NarL/FixJ family response regulator